MSHQHWEIPGNVERFAGSVLNPSTRLNVIISSAYNEADKHRLKSESKGRKLDLEQIITVDAETSNAIGGFLILELPDPLLASNELRFE